MIGFFDTFPIFWYGFVFLFLFSTGIGAAIQCWFSIKFCGIESKKRYYFIYLLICYIEYFQAIFTNMLTSPVIDTVIGIVVLFVFIKTILKQNYILSAIVAALIMAVTTLVESMVTLLNLLIADLVLTPQTVSDIIINILLPGISFVTFKFFVDRYSIKSRYKAKYLLVFSLPMFFIAIVLRTINYIRYINTTQGFLLQSDKIKNYEMIILTIVAFLCICALLFVYEKMINQIENENANTLLRAQISAQESYIAEAKQKYEVTKAFRHDFRNHIIALRGLIDKNELEKARRYIDRFETIDKELAFLVTTGNIVVDILLSEKLSYAQKIGIDVRCDVSIPNIVRLDDFDLCAIFANAIDNAIKACASLEDKDKFINIIAKQNNSFLIIDMQNNYKVEKVSQGSGIGLSTIQIIADKYHGVVEISTDKSIFRISIILPF